MKPSSTNLDSIRAIASTLPIAWIAEQIGFDVAEVTRALRGDCNTEAVLYMIENLLLRLETGQIELPK